MRSVSSGEARKSFSDTLNCVAYGSEHIAIHRAGKDPVYMIPAKDYELFLKLLEESENISDLHEAEQRMHATHSRVKFEQFFEELEAEGDSI